MAPAVLHNITALKPLSEVPAVAFLHSNLLELLTQAMLDTASLTQQVLPALAARAWPLLLGHLGARAFTRRAAGGAAEAGGLDEEERARAGATGGAERLQNFELERLFDLTGRTAFVTGAAQGMGR